MMGTHIPTSLVIVGGVFFPKQYRKIKEDQGMGKMTWPGCMGSRNSSNQHALPEGVPGSAAVLLVGDGG
jgi:hypothetical protein